MNKRKKNIYTNDNAALTLGHDAMDWYFTLTDSVENDVVVHGIFNLPQNDQPADLQAKTDAIVMRLHEITGVFADFAGRLRKYHAKS